MSRYLLATILAFVVSPAQAVSVVADLPDQTTTHCIMEFDSVWGTETAVVTISGTRLCAFDVSAVPEGAHNVRMRAVKNDPLWGRLESVPSSPLSFTRPAAPAAPAGTRLVP